MEMKNDRGKGGGENDHDWMRIFFSFFFGHLWSRYFLDDTDCSRYFESFKIENFKMMERSFFD